MRPEKKGDKAYEATQRTSRPTTESPKTIVPQLAAAIKLHVSRIGNGPYVPLMCTLAIASQFPSIPFQFTPIRPPLPVKPYSALVYW